ncbi:MAG: CHAT domain-containing protein [Gloeotrichia echinulata GP01]
MLGKFNFVQRAISQVKPNQKKLPNDSQTNQQAQNSQNNQQREEAEKAEKASDKNNRESYDKINPYLIDKKFNRQIAIIYVIAENNQYRVQGFHDNTQILNTPLSNPPFLSFSQQMEGDDISTKLRQISGKMIRFSTEDKVGQKIRGEIIKLKNKLESENQNLSFLVIHDNSDFEIPWEMLNLSEDDAPDDFLGESIITVRWQDMDSVKLCEQHNNLIGLGFDTGQCSGTIVGYTNTKDFKNVEQEINTINKFDAILFENISDFLDHLENVQSEISLMFIASHGFFGTDISEMYLGEDDQKQRVYYNEFYDYDFDFLKTYRSIVFMNACHSGRLRRDKTLNIKYRIGFPTFFLKRGARGVIGTLGKVIDKYAAIVTNNFFDEYQKNKQLPVAAILRNIRAEAARNFRANKTPENRLLFIFTFMYVYYGNPMTTLQLTQNGEQPHV